MTQDAQPPTPSEGHARPDLPALGGRDTVLAFLAVVLGTGLGLTAGAVPALLLGVPSAAASALALVTSFLGGAAGVWLTLVRRHGWGLREIGFTAGIRSAWHLLWEVPLLFVLGLVCTVTVGILLGTAPSGSEQESISDALTAAPWALVVAGLCVVALVPALEEIAFRRLLLGWLRTRVPVGVAVVLTAAAFAGLHVAPPVVLYTFFLGLSTSLLFLWHRTLWAPLALHAVNNLIASAVVVATLTA